MRVAFTEFVNSFLIANHASHQCYEQVAALFFCMPEFCQQVMCLLFRCLPHTTGVEDDKIRLLHTCFFPAKIVEQRLYTL